MSSRRRFLSTSLKAAGGFALRAAAARFAQARRRRPGHPLRHRQRRRDARSRHRLEPHRSPRPHARRVVDDRIVSERAARARSADDGRGGLHRARRSDRAAARTADFLSRAVRGSRRLAQSQHSRRRNVSVGAAGRRAMSRSPGLPTPSARAGASTRRGAACACTRRCASRARTFSFIPATRSTRTRRCRRKSGCPTARCGETSSRLRSRRSPKRSTSSAAITRTTCSTTTCGGSTGRFRSCGCGTTTR